MRILEPLVNAYDFTKEVAGEYVQDNGSLAAAAVGFYVFLSLVPMLLLAVAGVGFLLGSPERARDIVFTYIKQYSPSLAAANSLQVRAMVNELVHGRGAATGIGLVFMLWSGTSLMVTLERAINVAWDCDRQRMFLLNRLLGLGMLVTSGVLFLISFGVTTALDALKSANICLLGLASASWPWMWGLFGYLVPLTFTIIAFTLMYKVLPCTFVPIRAALFGGLFAGILWEAAKLLFSFYVSRYAGYSRIYGSLTGIIVLMVWINYSAIVAIVGAEAASVWARRHVAARI